jgi:hypothetical protein
VSIALCRGYRLATSFVGWLGPLGTVPDADDENAKLAVRVEKSVRSDDYFPVGQSRKLANDSPGVGELLQTLQRRNDALA